MQSSNDRHRISWFALLPITLGLLWAAHAFAFFLHEYAHAFTAWALGWKRNPLALNYAHPTLAVLLVQLGISQNVDEVPIFASGHGVQAAMISAAGAVLGNGLISLSLSRWLYSVALRRGARVLGMFAYWCTVASIGNFIDYVPVRTFVTGTDLDQDMYAVELGMHWSPWTLLVLLGVPTAMAFAYFFARIQPRTLCWLFPCSAAQRAFVAVLTAGALFAFYGAAGWSGVGAVSHAMSLVSVCLVMPVMGALTAVLAYKPCHA